MNDTERALRALCAVSDALGLNTVMVDEVLQILDNPPHSATVKNEDTRPYGEARFNPERFA